jgi:hypothetical protein
MAKYILIIGSTCKDLSHQEEFNDWYKRHIVDLMSYSPEVVLGTRYEQVFVPGTEYQENGPDVMKANHLALYEIETENIEKTMQDLIKGRAKVIAEGRGTDLFERRGRGLYKRID